MYRSGENYGMIVSMEQYRKLFLHVRNIERSSYVWNMTAGLLFACQSAVMLMVINRTCGMVDSGIFSIAYAIGSLMSFIGEWGVRRYQVSDINEEVSFGEYYALRILTCAAMMAAGLAYAGYGLVLGGYSMNKFLVVLMVLLVKLIESFTDVFYGMFQQHRRLDVGAKTNSIRITVGMLACMVCLVITGDLLISTIVWFIVSLVGMFATTIVAATAFVRIRPRFRMEPIRRVAIACLPLFIGSFLLIYIGNAGKYAIDAHMDEVAQAQYNFIFMPVFVVNMLANFVFNPVMVAMTDQWKDGNFSRFRRMLLKQCIIIGGITALAVAVALTIGCPVLGILFGADLHEFKAELVLLMIGSGMLALVNFFMVVVTIIRYQRFLTAGYIGVAVIAWLLSGFFVKNYGIMGAAMLYTVLMSLLAAVFLVTMIVCIRAGKKEIKEC